MRFRTFRGISVDTVGNRQGVSTNPIMIRGLIPDSGISTIQLYTPMRHHAEPLNLYILGTEELADRYYAIIAYRSKEHKSLAVELINSRSL